MKKINQLILSIFVLIQSIFLLARVQEGPITKEYIAHFVPQNPVIVEAGAHKGFDTVELVNIWPNGVIHSFEPVPNLYVELKNRTLAFSNCYCYPLALAEKNERKVFYLSSGTSDQSSSLLKPEVHLQNHPTVTFPHTMEVNAITLDSWAQAYSINKVDFMWLDMQGSEPAMLRASPNILKTVKVIYTEINFQEMYKGCELFSSFKQWLEGLGFTLVAIDYTHYKYGWGDALFIR